MSSIRTTDLSHRRISYKVVVRTRAVYCYLQQGLVSGGALKYVYYSNSCTVVQRRSTSNIYVQSFVFADRIEWRLLESIYSINSAECCEFHKKNRPIASEDTIHTWSYMLGLYTCTAAGSGLSGGALRYKYLVLQQQYSSSEVFYFG